jgi:hypothetical protein
VHSAALELCGGDRSWPALKRLLLICKLNRFTSFAPFSDEAVDGTGLWLGPSRFNHSCCASCCWSVDSPDRLGRAS